MNMCVVYVDYIHACAVLLRIADPSWGGGGAGFVSIKSFFIQRTESNLLLFGELSNLLMDPRLNPGDYHTGMVAV